MSSGPKQKDYEPSETEKTQARIAAEEQRYFEQTYQPLFLKQMEESQKRDLTPTFPGRAQADSMQALTGRGADVGAAFNIGDAANIASGAISNIASGRTAAEKAETGDKLNALSQSLGLGAAASSGLAQAGRLAASEGLSRARAKQQVRLARNDAIFKGVKAAATMGMGNIASGGSFSSGVSQMQDPSGSGKLGFARTNFFGTPDMSTFQVYNNN